MRTADYPKKCRKLFIANYRKTGVYYWINWTALLRPLFHCNHRKEKIFKFSVRTSFRKFSKRFFSVARQHSDRRSVKDKFVNWKRTKQNWTYKVMVTHSRWEERDFNFPTKIFWNKKWSKKRLLKKKRKFEVSVNLEKIEKKRKKWGLDWCQF